VLGNPLRGIKDAGIEMQDLNTPEVLRSRHAF